MLFGLKCIKMLTTRSVLLPVKKRVVVFYWLRILAQVSVTCDLSFLTCRALAHMEPHVSLFPQIFTTGRSDLHLPEVLPG